MNVDLERKLDAIEQAVKRIKFSWFPFWLAGYMFTLGYANDLMGGFDTWGGIAYQVLLMGLWPLFLGIALRGG